MIKFLIVTSFFSTLWSFAIGGEIDNDQFIDDTFQLQKRLGILGLAGVVIEDGEIVSSFSNGTTEDSENSAFTVNTPIEVASITKALTAILVAQADEIGELNYEDFVNNFEPDYNGFVSPYVRPDGGPKDITIRQIVTHTSEGMPGEDFVYSSSRYRLLSTVLEKSTNHSFEELVSARILKPAGMIEFPSPNLDANNGLVTSAQELAKFAIALDKEIIFTASQQYNLCKPVTNLIGEELPIGLGMFSQEVSSFRVCWSYGQSNNSSAIFVRLPQEKLTLIIVANSNALTDPFRLLMANIQRSPFVMSFIRAVVAKKTGSKPYPKLNFELPPIEFKNQVEQLMKETKYSYREDLVNELLVRHWLNRDDSEEVACLLLSQFSDAIGKEDAVIQFVLQQMNNPVLIKTSVGIGETLVKKHPFNRWHLYMLANAYSKTNDFEKAVVIFERINSLPNQNSDPLFRELFLLDSKLELAKFYKNTDIRRAKKLLKEVLDLGISAEESTRVKNLLEELE